MVSLRRFSKHERKEFIVVLLRKSMPRGLTTAQIAEKIALRYPTLTSILREMIEEKKIRRVKFGNAYLYKIK